MIFSKVKHATESIDLWGSKQLALFFGHVILLLNTFYLPSNLSSAPPLSADGLAYDFSEESN